MARLVAAKCPNCGAGLRIDPDKDLVTCGYCQTSAFVRTQARPLTQQLAQQYPVVIDLPPPPKLGWVLGGIGLLVVVVGVSAAYTASTQGRGAAARSPGLTAEALDRDLPVPFTPAVGVVEKVAEPGREMRGAVRSDSPPSPAAGESTPGAVAGAAAPIKGARVREGHPTVSGRLSAAVISGVVRTNFGRFRMCYEEGLARTPGLRGRVEVRFVVGRDGSVSNVSQAGSDLGDTRVVSCVVSAFYGLSFPAPAGGIVTVVYPLSFSRG
jgi:ribosomal protein S27AE